MMEEIIHAARKGKIARLPKALRDEVCQRMEDGATYGSILTWLNELPEVKAMLEAQFKGDGVNEQNLTNWRQGGFLEWKTVQDRIAGMTRKQEFALDIVKANEGGTMHEATLLMAASQLYDVLGDFDVQGLKETLAEKPELYSEVVNSLAKLSKGSLELNKFKDHVASRKAAIEAELGVAQDKGGIQPETLERIKRELNLL
jgi:hypothetical protein